jgi:ferredoxin-thioredoxin reductase catalytic subunit
MNKSILDVTDAQVEIAYQTMKKEAIAGGYNLNPDIDITKDLVKGLLTNQKRYGYGNCPCRLASGQLEDDQDIVCPCDYRDADIAEFDACYWGLYVSETVVSGKKSVGPIPERRPALEARQVKLTSKSQVNSGKLAYPVWRCKVCGYLCARDGPPEICPICKAKKERFERFIWYWKQLVNLMALNKGGFNLWSLLSLNERNYLL